jgi:hypothetical protein
VSLKARLARLEASHESPAELWLQLAPPDGPVQRSSDGRTLSAAEFERQYPDARRFTIAMSDHEVERP